MDFSKEGNTTRYIHSTIEIDDIPGLEVPDGIEIYFDGEMLHKNFDELEKDVKGQVFRAVQNKYKPGISTEEKISANYLLDRLIRQFLQFAIVKNQCAK
jgi:hypothetical protein